MKKKILSDFSIDEQYLTDVQVVTYPKFVSDTEDDEFIRVLAGNVVRCIGSKDHDEFTKLREQLKLDGFIEIERSWWNGDRVLKPFTLNGVKFKKHEKFVCATAMKGHLKFARKYG